MSQISLCMIVKNEQAGIERCLRSARPHVDEIIVVDTGSTDATVAVAAGFADRVVRMADCNNPQTGLIEDFAQARNYAFDLATKPWVFWMDGDDELVGGEHLRTLAGFAHAHKAARWQIPYEYTHDANGNCTCIQERERLVSPRSMFRWVHPIHETLNAIDPGVTLAGRSRNLVGDQLRVVHRHDPGKSREPGRNLRILEAWYAKHGEADARILFYLGRELSYTPQFDRAVEILSRYIELSGWDEEKCLAAIRLAEMFQSRAKPDQDDFMPTVLRSIDWGARAMALRPDWGEAYFCLARSYFLLAEQTALQGDYLKVAEIASMGLDKTPTETKTALFVNPRDRLVEIHRILNIAYNKIGRTDAALRSVVEALEHEPNDESLNRNKRVYEQFMARGRVIGGLAELQNHGMAPTTFARVMAMVDGPQPEPASIEWGDIALAKRRFPEVGADAPAMPSAAAATDWPPYHRPATWPKVGVQDFRHARVSPHAQAWAVPEQVVLDDLPIDTTAGQVLALTIQLWKEYLLHDEVLAAERLLADAPYRIKHNASVQRALAMTRQTFAWMQDHDAEQRINAPADPMVETGVPLPGELSGQLLGRMQIAQARIRPGERVLDFGCSDGSIANRLALAGVDITGVDLCATSIALAQKKAEEFKTGARFICSKFSGVWGAMCEVGAQVVITTDTYEHLIDPVRDMLLPARDLLNEDTGRLVLCTPYGAWMRGQFVSWAHPWRWADERGLSWNAPVERAHLVAPTPWTVADNLRKAGFYVFDSYVELCEVKDVPDQGNVVAEAHCSAPQCDNGPLDIVIAGPAYSYESWTPRNLQRGGIGGSETAVIEVAKRLAACGHRVRVYATPGEHGAGVYAGVEYRQTGRMAKLNGVVDQAAMTEELDLVESCDLLIAWRYADMLDHVPGAKRRWLWVHDVYAHAGTPERLAKADRILALSQWHRDFMAQHYGIDASRFTVTRNGIDLSRFEQQVPRDRFKVVNSSSPDRSWQALLQLWPQVRAAVPQATLHLFYGFDNWEKTTSPTEQTQIAQLKARIAELAGQGVVLRGRVDQQTLAREFLSAGVLAYPTWFSETSCIGAMEAQAAGLHVVTSPIAALNETVGPRGTLIEGDWLSADYQRRFAGALVAALHRGRSDDQDRMDRLTLQAHARAHFNWDGVVEQWEQWGRDDLTSEPVRHAPAMAAPQLMPYEPAKSFRRTR